MLPEKLTIDRHRPGCDDDARTAQLTSQRLVEPLKCLLEATKRKLQLIVGI